MEPSVYSWELISSHYTRLSLQHLTTLIQRSQIQSAIRLSRTIILQSSRSHSLALSYLIKHQRLICDSGVSVLTHNITSPRHLCNCYACSSFQTDTSVALPAALVIALLHDAGLLSYQPVHTLQKLHELSFIPASAELAFIALSDGKLPLQSLTMFIPQYPRAAFLVGLYLFAKLTNVDKIDLPQISILCETSQYFKVAANEGLKEAQYYMFLTLRSLRIGEKSGNVEDELKWLKMAAADRIPAALFELGYQYIHPSDVYTEFITIDVLEGVKLIREAAELGHLKAFEILGYLYKHGKGRLLPDDSNSLYMYYCGADLGSAECQYRYSKELLTVEGKENACLAWAERAAEQCHIEAAFFLGKHYLDLGGSLESEGRRWVIECANRGLCEAQLILGYYHLTGKCGFLKDSLLSEKWISEAADQGDAKALYLRHKQLQFRNQEVSIDILESAALKGSVEAQIELGSRLLASEGMYESGVNILEKTVLRNATDHCAVAATVVGRHYEDMWERRRENDEYGYRAYVIYRKTGELPKAFDEEFERMYEHTRLLWNLYCL